MGESPAPLVVAEMAAGAAGAEGAPAAFSDGGAQACLQIVGEASIGAGCVDRSR
ncbi:MAG: hypothetical protein ABL871_07485 [Terricaulis sp.]